MHKTLAAHSDGAVAALSSDAVVIRADFSHAVLGSVVMHRSSTKQQFIEIPHPVNEGCATSVREVCGAG
jgi:hypothetical protein